MGNCLKTQLKEVVNNGNLCKIGEIRITTNPGTGLDNWARSVGIKVNSSIIIKVLAGGPVSFGGSEYNVGESITIDNIGSFNNMAMPETETTISINNGYNVTGIIKRCPGNVVNVKDLKYIPLDFIGDFANLEGSFNDFVVAHPNLKTISQGAGNIQLTYNLTGDISCFENNTVIESITLQALNISGNLASLLNCTALTSVTIDNNGSTPYIVSTQATIDTLRSRGVTVVIPEANIIPE